MSADTSAVDLLLWRLEALQPRSQRCLRACLPAWLPPRYPADRRRPLAVWRGSTTDTKLGSFNKDNYMQVRASCLG